MKKPISMLVAAWCFLGIGIVVAQSAPVPYDGAASVPAEGLQLAWASRGGAGTYQVYLGARGEDPALLGSTSETSWFQRRPTGFRP